MSDFNKLYEAHRILFERYMKICEEYRDESIDIDETHPHHLGWMCASALGSLETFPVDKLSRWLGFIQGCLTMRGLITVQEERDFSRPLFHAAYGENAPPTVNRI